MGESRSSASIGHVVATGLSVPEGPARLPDGTIVFTEQTAGRISRLTDHGSEPHALTGGAPNSCAVGEDGELYVCQNGGVVGSWRSTDPRKPSIQVISPSGGTVDVITSSVGGRPLLAPNDLAFSPAGRLHFTDPAQPFDPRHRLEQGAIYALGEVRSEDRLVVDVGAVYCNGMAFGLRGELFWVESYTRRLQVLTPDGPSTLARLPAGHTPDGIAVANDGRIFIASCTSHCIDVVEPDGNLAEAIYLDERANPTNCCFDGSDLIVTDFGIDFETVPHAGRLWRLNTDAVGAVVNTGSLQ